MHGINGYDGHLSRPDSSENWGSAWLPADGPKTPLAFMSDLSDPPWEERSGKISLRNWVSRKISRVVRDVNKSPTQPQLYLDFSITAFSI
jgi:hypothetical protein